jgi:hypothetical protein
VARKVVLISGVAVAALATSLSGGHAWADNVDDDDLQKPRRLTVGVADDLLGQLSPDGGTLYFVSNRNTTTEIFARDIADGRTRPLFDEGADVTWPRVSPDGAWLLYISFRERVSGQLCLRHLPDGEGRRCLEETSATLQAEWIDRGRIALVDRESIRGDLSVVEVTVGATLTARPLVARNITSPAVSPDGRWLVYVPVSRTVETVGPAFAAHAAPTLEAIPLASAATAEPMKIALQLPGVTGQPAFARDGRSLYFAQFFADTNHDGTVDASDNGVLFRVPLSFVGGAAVAGPPEQLTDTSWNCEYPSPFANRLIATCSQDASLDVYSLPLDGEVPEKWTMQQLDNAIDDADTRVEEQLLTSRRLARETTPVGRRLAMLALAMVHLELEEFRAADYYAELIHSVRDATSAGISTPLRLLVEQRRAVRRREQGRLMEGFRTEARARIDKLDASKAESPMAEDLIHLVRSEIFDSMGQITQARTELEAVTVDATTPPPIILAYYERADAFYRKLDDREALVAVCRALSTNGGLSRDDQLHYARAGVRAMTRGLLQNEADALLVRERARATDQEPEFAYALDLARAVLAIRDAHSPKTVSDGLLALYAAQSRPGRRRALVVDAVQRADETGDSPVLDALMERDIHEVKPGTHERGEVEDIYERVILARAYERLGAKRFADARADFDSVAEQTGSLEAMAGAIDMALKLGEPPAAIAARYDKPKIPVPYARFAKAYLIARQLPKLEGEAHAKAMEEALATLHASWSDLIEERAAEALFGSLLHEQYLVTGDLAEAERANVHYLVALELAGDNPRFRAMILGELGLLHTDVGNYRIALSYLLERDKLPYTDNSEGLDVLLSKAQAILHEGRAADAAAAGEGALAMIARNPALAKYRPLALDWAAVDNLAAGHFARALALYDEAIPIVDASTGPAAARNRLVARISRAAAEVGAKSAARALADLDSVDKSLLDPAVVATLQWPHASADRVARTYRLIASGLRASANRELHQWGEEARAIEVRRAILDERLRASSRPEIAREEMLADAQLAWNAGRRQDAASAKKWLAAALARADDLRGQANGRSDADGLDVLRLAAALTVSMHAPLVVDLSKRIEAASSELAARREPSLKPYARWLEIYGALLANPTPAGALALDDAAPSAPAGPAPSR